ncbi:MAG TPA: M67 family metallopeptidase [Actinomycetota bacterium]|nr:M67 family metallopeptidase [Actinomycetota bacterium]
MLRIPRTLADAMIAQCRAEMPNEACGLLAGRDGEVTRLFQMTNAERSPVLYRMDPKEQLQVFREMEEEGLELVGIYHSHTRSPAYPSKTDEDWAYYPEAAYVIVSFADPAAPVVRAWRIVDQAVREEIELELA